MRRGTRMARAPTAARSRPAPSSRWAGAVRRWGTAELDQSVLQRVAAAVMQPMYRCLRAAERLGNLTRRHTHDVAQNENLALFRGQRGQRVMETAGAVMRGLVVRGVGAPDYVARDRTALPQMVERDVAGDPQDPGRERYVALVILRQRRHQLRED